MLQQIGEKYGTDKATFHKYCDFYEKNLPKRDFKGRLLEIGVMDGYSLQMWREYYPKAEIVGVDINNKDHLEIEGVQILQLDATNFEQLEPLGMFDIIVDDGSHMTADQQKSFSYLYNFSLNRNGFYIIEDVHTSFIHSYVNSPLNTIEFIKQSGMKPQLFHRDKKVKDSMCILVKRSDKK